MHYIRLLRPPEALPRWFADGDLDPEAAAGVTLSLVVAITTDLGDALLSPARPVELVVSLVTEWDMGGDDNTEEEHKVNVDTFGGRIILRAGVRQTMTKLTAIPSADRKAGGKTATAGSGGDKGKKGNKATKGKSKGEGSGGGGGSRQDVVAAPAWRAGLRVLKLDVTLDSDEAFEFFSDLTDYDPHTKRTPATYRRRLRIAPAEPALAVEHVQQFAVAAGGGVRAGNEQDARGRIVPLWVDAPPLGVPRGSTFRQAVEFPHVALRRLYTGPTSRDFVEVEEDIGESIARHVWDAGLAGLAFVTDACRAAAESPQSGGGGEAPGSAVADALHAILLALPPPGDGPQAQQQQQTGAVVPAPLRVLELGSGVGILGIGLAAAVSRLCRRRAAVLLTDLPDAEERLLANLARAAVAQALADGAAMPGSSSSSSTLAYEDLDWEDGRHGRFGPRAAVSAKPSRPGRPVRPPWDLVALSDCTYNVDMMPALVETLSALHAAAQRVVSSFVSHTLFFRKPRHTDEEVLFGLLADHGWTQVASSTVPLPGGGSEPGGAVEVYLYEHL